MKIRILHVVLSLGTGGLENGIVNTINGIDTDKFVIDVICLRELGELGDRITNQSTQVFFDQEFASGLKNAIGAIRKVNQKGKYDIIHTHGWATMLAGYIAAKLEKITVINGEHGTLYFDTFRQRLMQRFLFNRMLINLSVSKVLVNTICKRFKVSKDRFIAILNGVDVNKFRPDLSMRNEFRKEIGINDETILVGSVGRLVEVKNYPSLLRGFQLFNQQHSQSKLVLAGDGPKMKELTELSEELKIVDDVIFLGRRDDIPAVMSGLDIFVLPSFREGLSNTVLEAMASGLPAVVTEVGGNPEIVIEDKTGYLFEVDNIKQLSSILSSLANDRDKLNDISGQSRTHILDNYTLPKMVEHYQNVYLEIMRKSGGAY